MNLFNFGAKSVLNTKCPELGQGILYT